MGWRAIVLSGIGNIAGPEASWPRLETNGRNHMAEKKILITGATGATGGNAITKLLELKVPVRALVHQHDARSEQLSAQGVEIVAGDLSDFEAVSEALKGITGAYFVYPIQVLGLLEATAFFAQ